MTANINQDELRLLAYFHEFAEGYTIDFRFDENAACENLGLTSKDYRKYGSYLAGHGFVGLFTGKQYESQPGESSILAQLRSYSCFEPWLTSFGEDYMRSLEAAPSMPKKITATVVKESWGMIKETATTVLSEIILKVGGIK